MSVRQRLRMAFGLTFGVLLLLLGDWLDQLSDALWWRAMPWVLLALFWTGIGAALWRERRRKRQSNPV